MPSRSLPEAVSIFTSPYFNPLEITPSLFEHLHLTFIPPYHGPDVDLQEKTFESQARVISTNEFAPDSVKTLTLQCDFTERMGNPSDFSSFRLGPRLQDVHKFLEIFPCLQHVEFRDCIFDGYCDIRDRSLPLNVTTISIRLEFPYGLEQFASPKLINELLGLFHSAKRLTVETSQMRAGRNDQAIDTRRLRIEELMLTRIKNAEPFFCSAVGSKFVCLDVDCDLKLISLTRRASMLGGKLTTLRLTPSDDWDLGTQRLIPLLNIRTDDHVIYS